MKGCSAIQRQREESAVFLLRHPTSAAVDRFLDRSKRLPLSFLHRPSSIVDRRSFGYTVDETVITIGRGREDFDRACAALRSWKHYDFGWVEVWCDRAAIDVGANLAVLIRHLGFYSLNGGRVLYLVDGTPARPAFGFAYATLPNHAERGEELFEVFMDPRTGDAHYRIRAVSRPRAFLAWLGYPVTRALQARFRRDSGAAMKRATAGVG